VVILVMAIDSQELPVASSCIGKSPANLLAVSTMIVRTPFPAI
jgi:hypothetical protein